MSDLYISIQSAPYRADLCRALQWAGYRICFLGEGDLPVTVFRGKTVLEDPIALLEQERPRRVFAPEFSLLTLQLSRYRKRFGFKLISLCDDSIDMIQGNDFSLSHRLARRIVPRMVDEIVLCSSAAAGWYQERFGKGIVMPIMADEQRVRIELERVLPLSSQIRPSDKPIVAFVGRFVGLKNIPTLIRAFEPLRERAELVLIGDGEERETLAAMAPWAHFTGMLSGDTLLAWYNLIDILALPSFQEAYGAVTGEALMAGAKVVVSSRAGSSDLVREGENGFVVDPDDASGWAHRIRTLLDTVASGRPIHLRENLHPFRFADRAERLIQRINSI